ncbi:hypothetical protein ABKN59_012047 [Abortiporus biennis]
MCVDVFVYEGPVRRIIGLLEACVNMLSELKQHQNNLAWMKVVDYTINEINWRLIESFDIWTSTFPQYKITESITFNPGTWSGCDDRSSLLPLLDYRALSQRKP